MRRQLLGAITLLGWMVSAGPARSEAEDRLAYDLRWDVPVTVGAGLGIWGTEAIKKSEGVTACRWCESNAIDDAVRSDLKWSDAHAANLASDLSAFAALPLAAAGSLALAARDENRLRGFPVDALLVLESTLLAGDLSQIAKLTARRERPFVRHLAAEQKPRTAKPDDNNASFYSGHVNFAFALAVSAGTIASLRGYRHAGWVWGAGLPLAALVPYFRIAADRHYFTDVLVGAAMGSGVGFAVPYFFHRAAGNRGGSSFSMMPGPRGGTLSAQWTW